MPEPATRRSAETRSKRNRRALRTSSWRAVSGANPTWPPSPVTANRLPARAPSPATPSPVPGPERKVMPRWRTMIEPALTSSPSPAFTPRRLPTLSRPFLELPTPFLCAMVSSSSCCRRPTPIRVGPCRGAARPVGGDDLVDLSLMHAFLDGMERCLATLRQAAGPEVDAPTASS